MKPVKTQPLHPAYHQLSQLLHETLLSLYIISSEHDEKTALQKAEILLSLYERHIAKEEAILFGILYDYEPCVSAILIDDYKIIMEQINNLREMMLQNAKFRSEKAKPAGRQLLYCFNEFVNICLAQMKEHQSLINPVLWRYYSDEELTQMASAFTVSHSIFTYPKTAAA